MNEYTHDELKLLLEMADTARIGRFVRDCLNGMRPSQELEQVLMRTLFDGVIMNSYYQRLHDLLFVIPLTEVPLHIDATYEHHSKMQVHPSCRIVAKWRLTIGK